MKTSLQLYLNIVRISTLQYVCFLKKTIKTISMLRCNQFILPILNWVFCTYCIVIDFDVPLIYLGLKLSIQGNPSVFKILFECNYETFPWGHCSDNPGFQAPCFILTFAFQKLNCAN